MSSKEGWKIIKEDKHILVIYKPVSYVVQGSKQFEESLLLQVKEFLKVRDKKPGNVFLAVVHRLDKPVSGAVLFAKRSKSASMLFQTIQKGDFRKVYVGVVEGEFSGKGFLVDYLKYDKATRKVVACDKKEPTAKIAITYFESILSKKGFSVLLLSPITGRKHQLRVATSKRGAPIVGDTLYGSKIKIKGRILLHSLFLGFPHPSTREIEEIICPVLPSFLEITKALVKDPLVEKVISQLDKSYILEFLNRLNTAKENEVAYVSSKDLVKM